MAQLYFNNQLIATSDTHGVLSPNIMNDKFTIVYKTNPKKYYSIIIYNDDTVYLFLINVKGIDLSTGQPVVDYIPFPLKSKNNEITLCIYEQKNHLKVKDEFEFEEFITYNQLKLIHLIDFTILQKIDKQPNIFSNRVFYQKLKALKN